VLAAVTLAPLRLRAEPQWGTGIEAGVAGPSATTLWGNTKFFGAARVDVLFGRASNRDMGIGPALEIGTVAFSDLRPLVGATALVPLGEVLAVAVTPGAYARLGAGPTVPGLAGRVFFGTRPYNYGSRYSLSGGIVLGVDQDLGGDREHACVIAAQVDGLLLALPALLLVGWLRGAPD
jgi:hypothetical protein